MDKSFSSRSMEEKCKRDINFMYLLEGCTASDHANFARFGTLHFAPCALRNKNRNILKLNHKGIAVFCIPWYNKKMKTNKDVSRRISYIDRARGIAMLLMIVGHTLPGVAGPFEQGILDVACLGGGAMSRGLLMEAIYSFHMPLFFICSGMTYRFSNSMGELRVKMKRAFCHLVLPVLALYCITVLFSGLVDGVFARPEFVRSFLVRRFMTLLMFSGSDVDFLGVRVGAVGAVWFVMALFLSRFFFDFSRLCLRNLLSNHNYETLHLDVGLRKWLGAVSCILTVAGVLAGKICAWPFSLDLAMAGVGFLHMGYCFRGLLLEGKPLKYTQGHPLPHAPAGRADSASPSRYGLMFLGTWLVTFGLRVVLGFPMFDMAMRKFPLFPLCYLTAGAGTAALLCLCAGMPHFKNVEAARESVGGGRAGGVFPVMCGHVKRSLQVMGQKSDILLYVHYMAYVPYLYYQQVTDNVAIVCAVRLGVELALFGGVLWIQGKAVKGNERA